MSTRGIETREKLVETALRLFRDEGFAATTMRKIANEAEVSLGNAYYYFASKDELVHELYLVIQRDHRARALPLLREGGSLTENLRIVLHTGLDVMGPYHGFGSTFLHVALPTTSQSSPFSAESTDARSMAVDLMREALAASKQKTPASLETQLPHALVAQLSGRDATLGHRRVSGANSYPIPRRRPGTDHRESAHPRPAASGTRSGRRCRRPDDKSRFCRGGTQNHEDRCCLWCVGLRSQHLLRTLESNGVDVRTIGRGGTSDATWSDEHGVADVLSGTDLLVNLAGRSVSCRYNKRNADDIFSSRVETTALLGRALTRTPQPPSLWANASTGTIYRDARDRPMDEKNGELGKGFSVAVARAWEHELFSAPTPVRKVALRMSIVLGAGGGGAINPFVNLARMASADEWATADRCSAGFTSPTSFARSSTSTRIRRSQARSISHPPYPVTNTDMMRMVRAKLGRQYGFPTPGWMLEFGARIIRTEAELVTKSRWVSPGGARGQRLPVSISDVGVCAEPDRSRDPPARVASGFTRLKFGCDRNRSHDILLEQIVIQCNRSL